MRIGKVIMGILAAMAAGTILGILFAPDKGSVTRSKLTKKATDFTDEVNAKVKDTVNEVNRKMEALKEETGKIASEWKKKSEDVMADFHPAEKAKMN